MPMQVTKPIRCPPGSCSSGQKRNPRTRATVGQLLDRWLDGLDVDPSVLRRQVRCCSCGGRRSAHGSARAPRRRSPRSRCRAGSAVGIQVTVGCACGSRLPPGRLGRTTSIKLDPDSPRGRPMRYTFTCSNGPRVKAAALVQS
jgi:hypothetical protein